MKTKLVSLRSVPQAIVRHVVNAGVKDARIQADRLDLAEIEFSNPSQVETLAIFATTVIAKGDRIDLPGKAVIIIADRLEASDGTVLLKTKHFYFHFRECSGPLRVAVPGASPDLIYYDGCATRSVDKTVFEKEFEVVSESPRVARHKETGKYCAFTPIARQLKKARQIRLEENWRVAAIPDAVLEVVALLAAPLMLRARIQGLLSVNKPERQDPRVFLGWLVECMSAAKPGTEAGKLKALGVAQLLALKLSPPENYVPYLGPQVLEKQMGNLLSALEHLETKLEFFKLGSTFQDALTALNENVNAKGAMVIRFMQAAAVNEGDMAAHYSTIAAKKAARIASATMEIEKCRVTVLSWKATVEERLKEFQAAYKEERLWDGIFTMLECAGLVVGAIALAVPTGGTSLVAVGGATYEVVQTISNGAKLLHNFEKFLKGIETLVKLIEIVIKMAGRATSFDPFGKSVDAAVNKGVYDTSKPQVTLDAEWDEILNEFEASLPRAAEAERQKVLAAHRNLVAWMRNAAKLLIEVMQCQAEKEASENLSEICKAQQKRLKIYKTDAKSLEKVNWEGVKNDLALMEKNVQSRAVEVFTALRRAYEYQFDSPIEPLQPDELDLATLRLRLDRLWAQAFNADGEPRQKPTVREDLRVVFKNVQADNLMDGRSVPCRVTVKDHLATVFSNYACIRVLDVRAELSFGVQDKKKDKTAVNSLQVSTEGAKKEYIVEWQVSGEQFFDVTRSSKVIERSTDPMIGTSRYKNADNALIETTVASWWGDQTMNISPFTTWRVSVPSGYTETNKGLKMTVPDKKKKKVPATTVDVTLVFTVQAITVLRQGARGKPSKPALKRGRKKAAVRSKAK